MMCSWEKQELASDCCHFVCHFSQQYEYIQDLAAGCYLQNAETLLSRNDLVHGR